MKKTISMVLVAAVTAVNLLCVGQSTFADLIVGWGRNSEGQTNVPAGNDFLAIDGGEYHSLALRSDGSIAGWGWNLHGEINVPAGNDFVAIAGGHAHSLALKNDGSIVGWGLNHMGQINVPAGNDFAAIDAGDIHSLALRSDGSLVAWGYNGYGQTNVPGGSDFLAIAAGYYHNLALKSDGSLVGWGLNHMGQTNVPAGNDFAAIAAGGFHSLALKTDGSLVAWGQNAFGQTNVPVGNDFAAIAGGGFHSLALRFDGSLVGWGWNYSGQINVPAGNDFTAIGAGGEHSLALVPPCTPVSLVSLTEGPLLVQVENPVLFEATIADGCGEVDALWDFDDESYDSQTDVTNPVTATNTYTSAGIYNVVLSLSDDSGSGVAGGNLSVVVYDLTGGFVTGGGWIDSPLGAYTADPTLTGRANFGFVSKYKKGATVPTGNTEFMFKTADLNFHSSSYQWLVVNQAGSNAQFKGSGTINGAGYYKFMLWAGDGEPDTFRIRIWTEDDGGVETDVYDNGTDQAIAGGSIIVHKGKK